DDAHQNPNKPVVVEPEQVLTPVHANLARAVQFDARYTAKYSQHWVSTAANDTWDRHGYLAGSDAAGEMWRIHYWNMGQNLINVINQTRDAKPEYAGASYAMFCWSWLHLADMHGDAVILKQAFDANRLNFDYDQQQDVYDHVIKLADSAVLYLNRALADGQASARLAKSDQYFYNGNIQGYLKMAYGAKAMAFHRWYNKADYKPDSVIKYVNLSFANASEEAIVKFADVPKANDERNFYGPARQNLATFRNSEWFVNILKGVYWNNVVDPRLAFIMKPAANGTYNGLKAGVGNTYTGTATTNNFWGFPNTANVAGGVDTAARTYFKNNSPFPIMTYAQLQFVKAEAAFKKGDMATAKQAYVAGINGHFDHLAKYTGYTPISAADRSNYLANPSIVPVNAADLTRSQILMQKYIALWGYGYYEILVDLWKTKYDPNIWQGFTFPPTFFPDNGGKPVYRIRPRYNSEYLWNVEALKKIGAFDPDYHTRPTWFVNP
ncbi:MAG: SusD/RagB family nutrient-binding outer membrane lipoprotein, partial [Chitinophagaceae bacterium]|nr:SusD/RagB family nutrient-binding outer membrane lipoprotein [Chitinophagaceae bacterium]